MMLRVLLFCWTLLMCPLFGLAQTNALDRLLDAASKAVKKEKFDEADSLYENYVTLFRQQGLPKDYQYSEILAYLARRAMQTGKVNKAISIQNEVIEVKKTAPDCNYTQWASAISDLASFFSTKGDYTKAIETGKTALGMLEKKLGVKHNTYNIVLANLAAYYAARGGQGDYETAVSLGETAIKYIKKGTSEYFSTLNALIVYYSLTGNRDAARKASEQAQQETPKQSKTDRIHYATILNNQSIQLANAGNYDDAIIFAQWAKEYFELANGTQTLAYAKLLNNMATLYSHQHNYKVAIELLETALHVFGQIVDKQHPDYQRCISDLSAAYKTGGNLDKADELANESNIMNELEDIEDNTKFAMSLTKQAAIFASNGNYQRAIEHEQRAYGIFQKRKDTNNMAMSLSHLATYWADDGHLDKAFETAQHSLDVFLNEEKNNIYYAQALNNAALLYYRCGKYQTATQYGTEAQQVYEHIGDTVNVIYAHILANNALFSYVNNQLGKAIEMVQKALDIQIKILGDSHPNEIPLLYNMAVFYNKAGNEVEAEQKYMQSLSLQSYDVKTNFLHLTSQEREKYWNQKSYLFKYAPMLAYQYPQNAKMTTMAYNAMLFQKCILLNSDIDFRSIIKASGDKDLYQKYNKLQELKQQLANYHKQPTQAKEPPNNIQKEMYPLERTLVRGCKEYGNFTEDLNIDANQISQALHEDEAAIEFADIYINGRGNTYLALLIRKGFSHPKLIRLFSDDELEELKYDGMDFIKAMQIPSGIDSIYSDVRFGQMIWQPLLSELKDIHKLYFSPTSLFYLVGIEYLPCDSSHRINDLFEIYRVSSTKILAKRNDKSSAICSAVVYGGLNYDMSLSHIKEQHNLLADNLKSIKDETEVIDANRAVDSLLLRGSVRYLPGTLHEAEYVGEQLMQKGITTKMLMGDEGTEESFKALSGQDISILHIATHGFFISEKNIRGQNKILAFMEEQTENLNNPLNYSGILLSGANYVLNGGRLPGDFEDGILTANEISQIDFSKTDMVILSACQTGVGEIREDGVFGIQRGFKKAGVQTLLMSLWNVNDEAAVMMMTLFYKNLLAGLSKQEAFSNAQKEMRQSKFSNPFSWASFVLLDGF